MWIAKDEEKTITMSIASHQQRGKKIRRTEPEELIVLFPKLLCMCASLKSVAVTMLVDSATQWPFIHRKGMEKNEETDMQMSKIRKNEEDAGEREERSRISSAVKCTYTQC